MRGGKRNFFFLITNNKSTSLLQEKRVEQCSHGELALD